MISHRMHNIATMLRMRPDLALNIADRLDELAELAAAMENSAVPLHMKLDAMREAGVISLDAHRRRPAC